LKHSIQINFLESKHEYVAGMLHLIYDGALHAYLMAIDKEYNPKISLGNLLVWMCIKKAIEDGYTKYDFLKGDEAYKFHWTNKSSRSMNLELWKDSPLSKSIAIKGLLKDFGKIVLR